MGLENRKINRRDFLKGTAAVVGAAAVGGIVNGMRESPKTTVERTELEKRFAENIEIGGKPARIMDIPETVPGKIPIVVAPGFKLSLHTNSPVLEMISKEGGRRVLSLEHPAARSELKGLGAEAHARRAEFYMTELRKASNLLELINKKGVEKVNCFGFSEGALNTILAAYLHPEKFNSIILAAPAGLIGSDNPLALKNRFGAQGQTDDTVGIPSLDFQSQFPELAAEEERMREHIAKAWKQDEAAAWQSPLLTLEDVWALGNMQVDDMIRFVRAAGVKVIIVSGIDDQVFPHDRIEKQLTADKVDGYMTIRGAHGPQYIARSVSHIFDLADAAPKAAAGN